MHRDNKLLNIYKRDSFKNANVEVSTNHTGDTAEDVFARMANCSLLLTSSNLRSLWILFSTQRSLQDNLSRLQSSAVLQAGEHSGDRLQVIHIDIL